MIKIKTFQSLCFLILMTSSLSLWSQSKPDRFYLGKGPEVPLKTNAVLRYSHIQVEIKSLKRMELTYDYVITILDNEGVKHGTAAWFYDSFTKITEGNIWIYDPLGNMIDRVKMSEMSDRSYSSFSLYQDTRLKYYKPIHKKTPYTVHIRYKEVKTDFFGLPTWYPQEGSDIYVEEANYSIINNSKAKYIPYIINIPDSILEEQNLEDGSLFHSWQVKEIIPIDVEEYGPVFSEQIPRISFPLEQFQLEGHAGSFEDWKSFGQWNYELNKNRKDLSESTQSFIANLTNNIQDPKEKAKAVYKWMQSQTRYVSIQLGIGGWQSFPASDVDEKKYGDCKALSNYTQALLNSIGIEAYYSVVKAGVRASAVQKDNKYNQFNHAILCLPFEGDTTWLECTSQKMPFGYIGDFTDNRYTLVVKDGESQLLKTTKYDENDNLLSRITKVNLNAEGGIAGHYSAEYHNIQTEGRFYLLDESEEDQKDEIYESMNMNGFFIEDLEYQFIDSIHPIIREEIDFRIRKIATTTSTKMFVPLLFYKKKESKIRKDEKRQHEIILRRGYTEIDTVIYQIPDGFQLSTLPKVYEISSDFGSYESSIQSEGQQIFYIRKEIGFDGRFPADRFEEFRDYKNQIIKADKTSMVLIKTNE